MDNNKKSAGTIALVVLLLIVTIASLILATYAWAKYTTKGEGGATATVAKWDVSFDKGATIFTKTYNYVAPQRLAPGMEGEHTMSVNGTAATVYDNVFVPLTNNKAANHQSVTIYWYWPYQTGTTATAINSNDIIDTADGVDARTMSFDVTLTATQVNPNTYSNGTASPSVQTVTPGTTTISPSGH